MKNLLMLFITLSLFSCRKTVTGNPVVEPSVTKQVDYLIKSSRDYSPSVYNSFEAEVRLAVYRQVKNPYENQLLWDTIFTKQPLTQLPGSLTPPQIISKTFTGIKDSEVNISANYSIVYYMNGTVHSQIGDNSFLQYGNITKLVIIAY